MGICHHIFVIICCTKIFLITIAGVATAFAARDILGNVLSGLSVQFSKPFSVGDNIKVNANLFNSALSSYFDKIYLWSWLFNIH